MTEVSSAGSEYVTDKVVLVGDVGVGKTSIFLRFKTGKFQETTPSHNPRDGEWRREWQVAGSNASMTLFDTAGIERHMSTIPPTYFRWSKVVMLVYSIDDSDTFDSLTGWSENAVSARVGGETLFVLVGNKSDMGTDRQVEKSRALQYASNIDIEDSMVFEVSALSGDGFESMFNAIALKMGPVAQQTAKHDDQVITIGAEDGQRSGKPKCC